MKVSGTQSGNCDQVSSSNHRSASWCWSGFSPSTTGIVSLTRIHLITLGLDFSLHREGGYRQPDCAHEHLTMQQNHLIYLPMRMASTSGVFPINYLLERVALGCVQRILSLWSLQKNARSWFVFYQETDQEGSCGDTRSWGRQWVVFQLLSPSW